MVDVHLHNAPGQQNASRQPRSIDLLKKKQTQFLKPCIEATKIGDFTYRNYTLKKKNRKTNDLQEL